MPRQQLILQPPNIVNAWRSTRQDAADSSTQNLRILVNDLVHDHFCTNLVRITSRAHPRRRTTRV
jgi:hypothetical protein